MMSLRTSPDLPAWGVVSKIEPSHFDAASAYICVDFHLMDNRDPWVYKTTDFGKTWTKISDGLPKGPLAYARVIAENPNKKGNLFVGTGNAFYYTLDDGAHWKQLQTGLPAAPVSWIVVQKAAHDIVLSTYGRGLYIMEDITPLEQGVMETATDATPDVRLVAPRPAYRIVRGQARAQFSYVLKAAPKAPVEFEILDSKGALVRKLANISTAHAGPQSHLLGSALRGAAAGGPAHHAAGKSAHLGRAALPGPGDPRHHPLGTLAGRSRPHRGARPVHRENDGGWPDLHPAADHPAHARWPRRRRRAAIQRAPATQGARRYHRGQQHDQPVGVDAAPVGGSVEDARRQGEPAQS